MARRNIGVAFAVPEPYRSELQEWRERVGDDQARKVPPHVTLLPPTAVRVERLPVIEGHLDVVAAGERPFEIVLRGSATFRPVSQVTFVPLAAGISDCERIEAAVRRGPLARELRFNYHPHVTVAHDVDDVLLDKAFEELAHYEARFTVDGFTLFEEHPDGVWRARVHYPFGS